MQCGVRDQLTACQAQGFGPDPTQTTTHGFVLSLNDSRAVRSSDWVEPVQM